MAAMGTMFGSGAIMPFNTTRSVPEMLSVLGKFYAHESCGQCTPCREGTGYVKRILNSIVEGKGHDGDLELLVSLCKTGFSGTTICPLSLSIGAPVQSYIQKFRGEFEAMIEKNPEHTKPRLSEEYRPQGWW
jgi:NADH-quinone oxidoreductase subunit F